MRDYFYVYQLPYQLYGTDGAELYEEENFMNNFSIFNLVKV